MSGKPKTTAAHLANPKSLGERIVKSLDSPIARVTRVEIVKPEDLHRGHVQSEEWDKQGRLISRTYYE